MTYYVITFIESGLQLNFQTGENLEQVKMTATNEETFKNIGQYATENNVDILSIEPDFLLSRKLELISELKHAEESHIHHHHSH